MYKVEIKNLASEVYNCSIIEILEIVSTFAQLKDIVSITKVTNVNQFTIVNIEVADNSSQC